MSALKYISGRTQFITRLGDDNGLFDSKVPRTGEADADIVIGGSDPGKFESIIEMSKWGKYSLSIRDLDMPKTDVKSFTGDRVIIERGGIRDIYYPIDGKHLEHERVFASEPLSLKLQFELLHSSGMTFTRQNIEDFIPGSTYELNVPGSYCIDIDRSNNEFRAGKWGHLFVPELVDSIGRKIFVKDFRIENGMMKFELPRTWMRNAVYPVILDPTIGYTGEGALEYNNADYFGVCRLNTTTDGSGGDISTFHWFIHDNNDGISDGKAAVYDGWQNGANRVSNSVTLAAGSQVAGWNVFAVTGTLAATTDYFPAIAFESGGPGMTYDTGSSQNHAYDTTFTFADEMSNPMEPTPTTGNSKLRLYVTYGVAPGETVQIGKGSLTSTGRALNINAQTVLGIPKGSLTNTGKALSINQGMVIAIAKATMSHLGKAISVNDTAVISKGTLTATGQSVIANMPGYVQIAKASLVATGKVLKANTAVAIGKAALGMVGRQLSITGEVLQRRSTWLLYEAWRKKKE